MLGKVAIWAKHFVIIESVVSSISILVVDMKHGGLFLPPTALTIRKGLFKGTRRRYMIATQNAIMCPSAQYIGQPILHSISGLWLFCSFHKSGDGASTRTKAALSRSSGSNIRLTALLAIAGHVFVASDTTGWTAIETTDRAIPRWI
jgi:hypothetical protein